MEISFLTKFFGTKHERDIKNLIPIVKKINNLESEVRNYSDGDFKRKTDEFKEGIKQGKTESTKILPLAFAMVREASLRTLKLRHFDVQMMGGVVLYRGNIAEMKTGEGKTLTATLPAYLRAFRRTGRAHRYRERLFSQTG